MIRHDRLQSHARICDGGMLSLELSIQASAFASATIVGFFVVGLGAGLGFRLTSETGRKVEISALAF